MIDFKRDENIKYCYKLPNSSKESGFEYIIVGIVKEPIPDSRIFTMDE
jgi:hypothetical protein